MIWTTWENVGVDRMACAWFIRKYLDKDAEFHFLPYGQSGAHKENTFDTPDAEYSHWRGKSSFSMMVKRHFPKDRVLLSLAEIVDGADEAGDRLPPPESYGLEALCTGTRQMTSSDEEALVRGIALYDALFCYLQSSLESPNRGY